MDSSSNIKYHKNTGICLLVKKDLFTKDIKVKLKKGDLFELAFANPENGTIGFWLNEDEVVGMNALTYNHFFKMAKYTKLRRWLSKRQYKQHYFK